MVRQMCDVKLGDELACVELRVRLSLEDINVKKNCCFITMCKAHSKVTHIKQQKYFHHLKHPGYNTELLYPRPFR